MQAERIRSVMGAVLGIEPAAIGDDATPENIGRWDSLRHMNLVLALEEEFGVRFSDDQVEELVSFRLIERTLCELVTE